MDKKNDLSDLEPQAGAPLRPQAGVGEVPQPVEPRSQGQLDLTEADVFRFFATVRSGGSVTANDVSYVNKDEVYDLVKKEILAELHETPTKPVGGNPAAEWRLRVQRQTAVDNELVKLGPLALLAAGGLLTAASHGAVFRVERFSHWKETMICSPIYRQLDDRGKRGIIHLEFAEYNRLELGLQSFGQMLCLSVSDLKDRELIEAFNCFKVWCVNQTTSRLGKNNAIQALDGVLTYIKWLAKACQAVFLQSEIPEEPLIRPPRTSGRITPLVGELSFASDMILSGSRKRGLLSKEARSLAQLASTVRALPYPSKFQCMESIGKTVECFSTVVTPSKESLTKYRLGLNAVQSHLGMSARQGTHMSLVGKGTVECSRANGGRSAFLVAHCRLAMNVPLVEEHNLLIGRFDQYGNVLIDRTTWELSKYLRANRTYSMSPTLGDILFIKPDELEAQWQFALNEGKRVPLHLAEMLNVTAAKLLLEIGDYSYQHSIDYGVLNFTVSQVKFNLRQPLKVKADLSIEAGMKTRLITAGLAAFVHLSQAPSNFMRSYLSQDPFCRVGFEEADKLWEVLKQYRKETNSVS